MKEYCAYAQNEEITIGDRVVCDTGVIGIVIKKYYPTTCEQQMMIQCDDGRKYHAPTRMFRRMKSDDS